jgi:SAM-dependent methyltransferase
MLTGFSESFVKSLVAFALSSGKGTFHITRLAMYRALRDKLAHLDAPECRVLAISASVGLGRVLGLRQAGFTEAAYPKEDMLALSFADGAFDACVSDQVLEHVGGNPFQAFAESVRVVRPDGYVAHTTCLINPVHAPPDYWRFTTDALSLLARQSSCEVIELGGWGNREAWALIEAGFRFKAIPPDPRNPIFQLATRNEPDWPIVTWVVARRA